MYILCTIKYTPVSNNLKTNGGLLRRTRIISMTSRSCFLIVTAALLALPPVFAQAQQPRQNQTQQQAQQGLVLNDKGYFERQGVNFLVFSNAFTGGFNDEKNAGIEIIHHGVRTVQGGAVRLSKTPEQWDLVPQSTRRVYQADNAIEVVMRFNDYNFASRVVATAKGNAVELSLYLEVTNRVSQKLLSVAG